MPVTLKQKHTNEKWLAPLRKKYSKNYKAEIGFPEKAAGVVYPSVRKEYDDGSAPPRVIDVAVKNEFGFEPESQFEMGIPARPFMKLSRGAIITVLHSDIKKLLRRANRGALTARQLAEKVAPKTSDVIKRTIVQIGSPPNSPRTVTIKKSSNPLIDTGLMRKTVTWEVTEDTGVK